MFSVIDHESQKYASLQILKMKICAPVVIWLGSQMDSISFLINAANRRQRSVQNVVCRQFYERGEEYQ
jgi:hypothetical protein